jgi:hypothetical protein
MSGREEHESGVAPLSFSICGGLSDLYVLRLEAFRTFFDFELNGLAFLQAAESGALNFGVMDEDVALSTCTADETKSLCVVKPLHCSLFHKARFLVLEVPLNAIGKVASVNKPEQAKRPDRIRRLSSG